MACGCSSNNGALLYACSGASNVGYLADQVARRLMLQGTGKMTCLAGIGAGLESFTKAAASGQKNIVIDGCPVACGRKAFEKQGLACTPILLTDFGVEKGKTVIEETVIARITEEVASKCMPSGM